MLKFAERPAEKTPETTDSAQDAAKRDLKKADAKRDNRDGLKAALAPPRTPRDCT